MYNLHYFDDLGGAGSAARRDWHLALLQRWVDENPPPEGNGWEPYPTSLRIVNWIKWGLAGNQLPLPCLDSLALQAQWLSERLEWHLLGNHLFANAKALIFAGAFFHGEQADAWLKRGLHILRRELPEQILADGGHFERSPMYHSILLEDMLDLINLAQAWPGKISARMSGHWRGTAQRMLAWLHTMSHPDGGIAFFNDAAFGIAPTIAVLDAYATRLDLLSPVSCSALPDTRLQRLTESGYIRVEVPDAVALLDVAPVGPDYLLGHAHADTLSFELSLFGQRVLVNSGTSCYGLGMERLRQRGTAAHNTVEIDGQDSSEVWGGFRVARRAYPFIDVCQVLGEEVKVAAGHDGYMRMPGKNMHWRMWVFKNGAMHISDFISGSYRHSMSRFHVHPDVKFEWRGQELMAMLGEGLWVSLHFEHACTVRIVESTWHPEFGKTIKNQCIVAEFSGEKMDVSINWGGI
ncbi:alginate lyase family protein [Microvirgula aerodenitrificans]|uniref:heparinase II/III family protein n=1 Tax=Microvirgula aerodenitrificans TaxID=57480 RepID=UPI002F40D7B5